MTLFFIVCFTATGWLEDNDTCRNISLPMDSAMLKHECMIQAPQSMANWLEKEKLEDGYYIRGWHCEGSPV